MPTTTPTRTRRAHPRHELLSVRQREVLSFVARGYTSSQIANELYLSPETIRTHARNILEALGARSRAHAVAIGLRDGLIEF
jgi:DNA-binding NarL/FixJ family response regulator